MIALGRKLYQSTAKKRWRRNMIGHPLKVRELLDEIARGEVLLPEIQRTYEWKGLRLQS